MDSSRPEQHDWEDTRPVAPDVREAWVAAGSPSWALAVLPLLPDETAFEQVRMGPRDSVARWKARAVRLGLAPGTPYQDAA